MTLTTNKPNDWKDLQNKVSEILEQCGFNVKTELIVKTARGEVELDVYAEEMVKGRKYSIVCECKYWKANIPQNVVHGFRTIINDLGCNIGYLISTSDFQSGSLNTSKYTNVELLTWDTFLDLFMESWYESYLSPQIAYRLGPLLSYTEPILPKWFNKMTESDKKAFLKLKDKYDLFGSLIMIFTPYAKMINNNTIPCLPLYDRIVENKNFINQIPVEILIESGYKEFFEKCCEFGAIAIGEFRHFRDKYVDTQ